MRYFKPMMMFNIFIFYKLFANKITVVNDTHNCQFYYFNCKDNKIYSHKYSQSTCDLFILSH